MRRLAYLWRNSSGVALKNMPLALLSEEQNWRNLDIEVVCSRHKNIFIAADNLILHFHDLKFSGKFSFEDEEGRVSKLVAGKN